MDTMNLGTEYLAFALSWKPFVLMGCGIVALYAIKKTSRWR